MDFVELCSADDLPSGTAKSFTVGGREIAVFHTPRGFFAVDGRCPHRGGPLVEGDVMGDEIVCPWHLWGFNLESGVCEGNSDICIATHQVKVEGGRLLVRLSAVRETIASAP